MPVNCLLYNGFFGGNIYLVLFFKSKKHLNSERSLRERINIVISCEKSGEIDFSSISFHMLHKFLGENHSTYFSAM
ncbi:hypothetical protein MANES_16G082750v8 [Manihot esculenta]|uniref:Uncharacterized protein n=1 Tax=Manihot esculenta TaxID=3983 RepID=A0ACB7G7Z2_MANES|nr:hypothetical protein MANES_16G082750v8 [Manihot esculenta]